MAIRRAVPAVVLAGLLLAVTACSRGPGNGARSARATWAPAPQTVRGLEVLASPVTTRSGPQVGLHTADGDVTFWSGVNLGSTVPGHSPGELAQSATDFRRWLAQMGAMNVHFLRIYTLLPPAFYDELLTYNHEHATDPIYLLQGVYLPDESYVQTMDLYATESTVKFTAELNDVSDAVSGAFTRSASPGRASGTWTSDVSPWLVAWIIGAELDPEATHASELANNKMPSFHGEYFESTGQASPTEIWYAERMDELARAEVARGRSIPIAFINWPTTDPLVHPTEPLPKEDLLQLDANHVAASADYPGGTFASYHAYPYYPDSVRYTPDYEKTLVDGEPDAYVGYLTALKAHHEEAGLATMVTEFGVPSSIGSAHIGTNGRDQGAHTEQDAMAIDAALTYAIKDAGLSGALVFSWTDEWFKRTWNTMPRHDATNTERRSLWHDPLTNEQWFGVVAHDAQRAGWSVVHEEQAGVRQLAIDRDASFVYLEAVFDQAPSSPITLDFDVVGDGVSDVRVVVDPSSHEAHAYVRSSLDPVLMDQLDPVDLPKESMPGWNLQRLTTNRAFPGHAAEFYEIGNMIEGSWDPTSPDYDSMATWNLDGNTLDIRLPWTMLLIGDPSNKIAVTPDSSGLPVNTPVAGIGLTLTDGSGATVTQVIRWDGWNQAQYQERVKAGAGVLAEAWRDTSQ